MVPGDFEPKGLALVSGRVGMRDAQEVAQFEEEKLAIGAFGSGAAIQSSRFVRSDTIPL